MPKIVVNLNLMLTIEERANHFAQMDIPMPQDIVTTKWQQGRYEGYSSGAIEQQRITIDKACEWMLNNLPITQKADAEKQHYKIILPENLQEIITDFRKVMMEE